MSNCCVFATFVVYLRHFREFRRGKTNTERSSGARRRVHWTCSRALAAVIWPLFICCLAAEAQSYFVIKVVDEHTGRGVPLVELKTVNGISHWTDSNGIIAFAEPGLMETEVFFHVRSHGYDYATDAFGNRGVRLTPVSGKAELLKLNRLNLAERLYRVTGQGIYRDSWLAGAPAPLKRPVLNGKVMGQDTVVVTPYRGKLYWFWGDTERVSYPLGNFAVSGATSEWPANGGLAPSVGIDLTYFVDSTGFSKSMCPDFGPGVHWIESVMTVRDANGRERLVARVSSQNGLAPAYAWHLAVFNDREEVFESKVRWEIQDAHDSAHPFRARVGDVEYLYLYPNWRVKADFESLSDLGQYEAYTFVAGDGKIAANESSIGIDRDLNGRPRYSWKPGADRLHPGKVRELISSGKLQPEESWIQLHDIESGTPVRAGRGSVFWNEFQQRWILLITSRPGEVWFAEGDTPVGPWVYARRIVSHDNYNFYNPTQHPFFDEEGGRLIYFEGTYTAAFSNAKEKTPRYDYNQIMYRLDLEDSRLNLPVPVYRVAENDGVVRYLTREAIVKDQLWTAVESVAFFAYPPGRGQGGMIPVFGSTVDGHTVLRDQPEPGSELVFFILPDAGPAAGTTSDVERTSGDPSDAAIETSKHQGLVPLRQVPNATGGYSYCADADHDPKAAESTVVGWVWPNPMEVLAIDAEAHPLPMTRSE